MSPKKSRWEIWLGIAKKKGWAYAIAVLLVGPFVYLWCEIGVVLQCLGRWMEDSVK